MKKLALIAALTLLTQAAFAVVITSGATCTAANVTVYSGSQQYVCTNGVWAPVTVAHPGAAVVGAAAVGAAVAGTTGTTVDNTVVRAPTVVAPAAGADAAVARAAVPGTPATRAAVRAPGTPATRRGAARGAARVRHR